MMLASHCIQPHQFIPPHLMAHELAVRVLLLLSLWLRAHLLLQRLPLLQMLRELGQWIEDDCHELSSVLSSLSRCRCDMKLGVEQLSPVWKQSKKVVRAMYEGLRNLPSWVLAIYLLLLLNQHACCCLIHPCYGLQPSKFHFCDPHCRNLPSDIAPIT